MPAQDWVMVRVPAGLHEQLRRMGARIEAAGVRGASAVPSEFADRYPPGVPLWYVIQRAADTQEDKWKRSAKRKRKKGPECLSH